MILCTSHASSQLQSLGDGSMSYYQTTNNKCPVEHLPCALFAEQLDANAFLGLLHYGRKL